MHKTCPQCGHSARAAAAFCADCGHTFQTLPLDRTRFAGPGTHSDTVSMAPGTHAVWPVILLWLLPIWGLEHLYNRQVFKAVVVFLVTPILAGALGSLAWLLGGSLFLHGMFRDVGLALVSDTAPPTDTGMTVAVVGFVLPLLPLVVWWAANLYDALRVAGRLNRGETIGQWQCF